MTFASISNIRNLQAHRHSHTDTHMQQTKILLHTTNMYVSFEHWTTRKRKTMIITRAYEIKTEEKKIDKTITLAGLNALKMHVREKDIFVYMCSWLCVFFMCLNAPFTANQPTYLKMKSMNTQQETYQTGAILLKVFADMCLCACFLYVYEMFSMSFVEFSVPLLTSAGESHCMLKLLSPIKQL